MLKHVSDILSNLDSPKDSGNHTSPLEKLKNLSQKSLLKMLSKHALDLYQRRTDVKKFTKLVLSNPEDKSHEELIKDNNLDEYDLLFDVSNNDEFLKDIGL